MHIAGHVGSEAIRGARRKNQAVVQGFLVLHTQFNRIAAQHHGIAADDVAVRRIGERHARIFLQVAEEVIIFNPEGPVVPQGHATADEKVVHAAAALGSIGNVPRVADDGRIGNRRGEIIADAAERLQAEIHRAFPINRERKDEIVKVEGVLCAVDIPLRKHLVGRFQGEIRHDGEGIAGRDGGRIHDVHIPFVAQGHANPAHAFVKGRSGTVQVTYTKDGIRGKTAVGAILCKQETATQQQAEYQDYSFHPINLHTLQQSRPTPSIPDCKLQRWSFSSVLQNNLHLRP